MILRFVIFLFAFSMVGTGQAQLDTIRFTNPSFESVPRLGNTETKQATIADWTDCGLRRFPAESPPDIHPGNFWMNNVGPADGKTYIGMVVRDNDSWEGVGQRLSGSLKAGNCYKMTASLARSNQYISQSRLHMSGESINYTTPTVLRIWGGNGSCEDKELLGESPGIAHEEWRTYEFSFQPTRNYAYIMIEAFYKTPVLIPYNGHILVDNLSHIYRIECPSKNMIATVVQKENPKPIASVEKPKTNAPPHKQARVTEAAEKARVSAAKKAEPKAKILPDLDRTKIKTGTKIEIKQLYFKADQSIIEENSTEVIEEIAEFLIENPQIKIEIGGHTNGIPSTAYCDKLSTERAKAVYSALISKGVPESSLTYKGYGKRRRKALDTTPEGRNINQRVEITILNM